MGLVSIIIPTYNSSQTLEKVIQSVLAQLYSHWELIIIDDGSKDNTKDICESFSQEDKRIRYYYKENGGQSSARNFGLNKAQGDFIYFSDADDELCPNCLLFLLEGFEKDNVEIAVGRPIFKCNGKVTSRDMVESSHFFSVEELLKEFFSPQFYPFGAPWSTMFKASVIRKNRLMFDEKYKANEDRVFLVNYICHMKGLAYHTTKPIYMYNVGGGTLEKMAVCHNRDFVTIFYGQCEIYRLIHKNNFSERNQWWAKHLMLNSYVAKRKFYVHYKDFEVVDQMDKTLLLYVSKKNLLLFKGREVCKLILKPLLPVLRQIKYLLRK